MNETVTEAAKRVCEAWGMEDNHGYGVKDTFKVGFAQGAQWQANQSPWVRVKDRLPEENENVFIMCANNIIFQGMYCNGAWFYINDCDYRMHSKKSPLLLWEPIAWMPILEFNE